MLKFGAASATVAPPQFVSVHAGPAAGVGVGVVALPPTAMGAGGVVETHTPLGHILETPQVLFELWLHGASGYPRWWMTHGRFRGAGGVGTGRRAWIGWDAAVETHAPAGNTRDTLHVMFAHSSHCALVYPRRWMSQRAFACAGTVASCTTQAAPAIQSVFILLAPWLVVA